MKIVLLVLLAIVVLGFVVCLLMVRAINRDIYIREDLNMEDDLDLYVHVDDEANSED